MQINLSELFSIDGKEKNYTLDVEMDQYCSQDVVYDIVSKEPVTLRVRNLGDRRLLIQGSANLTLAIPCARCLEPVPCPIGLEIDDEVDMKQTQEQRVESLEEQSYISGYNLDIDQLLSNELLLNLPTKVLCSEDCKGICNRCGGNLNHTTCSCDQSSPDPRMSGIQDLFQQFKEV